MDGIPVRENAALDAAGVDRKALAKHLLQNFLRHAIRDGYFHADLHPGNLFADPVTGNIVAVDFGIMGRITRRERRFLAEVVYGFITRNYRAMAERHFEMGYVPKDQSVDDFALALRAIGEPLHGRKANAISMATVFGQLFTTTELFDMQTRPELVLLQKSMVLVEGVARALDPELDVWTIAEPVVGDWVRREAGPIGKLEDVADVLRSGADAVARMPNILARTEAVLADYEAERRVRRPPVAPWVIVVAFWLAVITCAVLLWRLVG
jgi:ubiquinone biosynthesis protein